MTWKRCDLLLPFGLSHTIASFPAPPASHGESGPSFTVQFVTNTAGSPALLRSAVKWASLTSAKGTKTRPALFGLGTATAAAPKTVWVLAAESQSPVLVTEAVTAGAVVIVAHAGVVTYVRPFAENKDSMLEAKAVLGGQLEMDSGASTAMKSDLADKELEEEEEVEEEVEEDV